MGQTLLAPVGYLDAFLLHDPSFDVPRFLLYLEPSQVLHTMSSIDWNPMQKKRVQQPTTLASTIAARVLPRLLSSRFLPKAIHGCISDDNSIINAGALPPAVVALWTSRWSLIGACQGCSRVRQVSLGACRWSGPGRLGPGPSRKKGNQDPENLIWGLDWTGLDCYPAGHASLPPWRCCYCDPLPDAIPSVIR